MKKQNPLTPSQMLEHQHAMGLFNKMAEQFSIPLYKELGGGLVDLVGTGFVIEHSFDLYLVTAAHVMDHHEQQRPLFYYVNDQRRQIVHGHCRSSSLDVQDRDNDRVDVKVVRLPNGEGRLDPAIGKRHILPDQVVRSTSGIGDCRFIVAGYPLTRYAPDHRNRRLNPSLYTWIGKSIGDDVYARLEFDRIHNVLVQFEQRHVMGIDGAVGGMFPKPRGMSGAPVWCTVGYRQADGRLIVDDVLLAGVLIEHIPEGKCFLATSIDIVVEMILDLADDA